VWNRRLYELLGRDPDGPDITGETFFEYIHKADLDRVLKHAEETIQKGAEFRDEFRIVRDDGKVRWLGAAGYVYQDETGRPVRMAGTNFDITKRKQAEEALRQSEEGFRTLNETIPAGVGVSSADGVFLYTNPAYELILGYNPGELLGKKASDLYVNSDNRTSWLKTMQKGGVVRAVETQLKKKDGTPTWVSINASNINYGGKKAVIGTIQDITERKLAEEALQRAHDELELRVQERTAELEDLNEALSQEIEKRKKFEAALKMQGERILAAYEQRDFLSRRLVDLLEKERAEIANTLHDEIGQAMAAIAMQLELLKRDASSLADRVEPIQEHLREAVRRAKGICTSLRSDVLEHFGLIPSIRELVDETQKQYPTKVHLFTKNVPERLNESDKTLTVYRLVQEALTNIHKHAEAKEVFINLTVRDGKLFLTIEDDGVGFDYGTIKRRADPSQPHLGITIMRERTSMVGGTFEIETAPGKGTHMLAEIPVESLDNQRVRD
jgi:PAS domain S-box-containing protein